MNFGESSQSTSMVGKVTREIYLTGRDLSYFLTLPFEDPMDNLCEKIEPLAKKCLPLYNGILGGLPKDMFTPRQKLNIYAAASVGALTTPALFAYSIADGVSATISLPFFAIGLYPFTFGGLIAGGAFGMHEAKKLRSPRILAKDKYHEETRLREYK